MDQLFALTLFLYTLCTLWHLAFIIFQKDYIYETAQYHLFIGFASHTIIICYGYIKAGYIPVQNLHETLSISSWGIIAFYILFQFKFNVKVIGAIISPLFTITMIISFLLPGDIIPVGDLFKSTWLTIHIISTFIGNGAFAIACGGGLFYLIQENAIKSKKRGFFYKRLPPLELLDNIIYASVAAGFPLLTIGIMTGCIYAQIVWGKYWSWDPKEVWSVITWLIYAAMLHGRMTLGWRGKRNAIFSIIGFLILLFTFLGVNFLLKGHHEPFTKI